MKPMPIAIITVDGPSGVGKGTLCARLSAHYGYHFLDSGALYRVLGLACHQADIGFDSDAAIALARRLPVQFLSGKIYLEQQDVTDSIRTETTASYASQVAVVPEVRQALLAFQQDYARSPGLVADGRDMGTIVFPQAQAKLFLEASAEVRANRRAKQLKNQGIDVKIEQLIQEIQERDDRDKHRQIAPMVAASDALVLDTSHLSPDTVFDQALAWINLRLDKTGV